jgi:hypothetical protein
VSIREPKEISTSEAMFVLNGWLGQQVEVTVTAGRFARATARGVLTSSTGRRFGDCGPLMYSVRGVHDEADDRSHVRAQDITAAQVCVWECEGAEICRELRLVDGEGVCVAISPDRWAQAEIVQIAAGRDRARSLGPEPARRRHDPGRGLR